MTRPFSIICVSPQPWHAELPTNRQQVMRRAARFGYDVVFVETAHFLGRDVWRLIRSHGADGRALVRRLAAGERVAPRITVRTAPWLAPWARRYRWANRLDTALTRILVRRLVRRTRGPVVLWLYDAASSSLVGRCGEAASVYDCVDDHVEVAGANPRVRALLAAADSQAAIASDLVFTTTRRLYERHRTANPLTHLVPNVGDYHHFAQAASRSIAADDVAALPRPLLGFTGNVAAWKVDFALLTDVALRRPDWTLALVGPMRADTVDAVVRLTALPNVHYLGARPYERLPAYVAAFDVGLCPYLWNAAMRSGFPLKLFEYLAAGKAVVASGNPDVAGMAPDVRLVRGADAFIRAVEEVLTLDGDDDRARRMALAAANTWESRTAHMLELVGPHVKT